MHRAEHQTHMWGKSILDVSRNGRALHMVTATGICGPTLASGGLHMQNFEVLGLA